MFGEYTGLIQTMMDASTVKRNVIADNVSNYNTPGFKATKADFSNLFGEDLNAQFKRTNLKHISNSPYEGQVALKQDLETKARPDGNNVDLNKEMIEMIKNNSLYTRSIDAINKEFSLIKMAIGQG